MKVGTQIAKNVRMLRANLNLTQKDIAARANVTQAYIGKIEKGESNMTIKVLSRLAVALEVEPSDLVSEIQILSLCKPGSTATS